MAFTIKLQTNKSEATMFDKELTDVITLSGTLKEDTSIVDPVILFECKLEDIVSCNYATIASFGRQYFITNIRSMRNNLVEISMHCDVLSSFAKQIRTNKAIVSRQENLWNLYLNDGSFHVYQNPSVLTRGFPSGFNTFELVLAVAGS